MTTPPLNSNSTPGAPWRTGSSGNRVLLFLQAPLTGLPVVGVTAPTLDFRYLAGGAPPLVTAIVPGGSSWQEISPADMPGWYSLKISPAWIATPGQWLAKLAPVSGSPTPFSTVAFSGEVVDLVLSDLQQDLLRALGLLQENYVLADHVYDPRGNLLGATVKLFSDPADVNLIGAVPFASYLMTATYDAQGRLSRYAVSRQ
jgi:hypothetical protein